MKLRTKNLIYAGICLIVAILGVGPELHRDNVNKQKIQEIEVTPTRNNKPKTVTTKTNDSSHMRTPIDWHKSSETIPYPDLTKVKNFWIKVSLKKNRPV